MSRVCLAWCWGDYTPGITNYISQFCSVQNFMFGQLNMCKFSISFSAKNLNINIPKGLSFLQGYLYYLNVFLITGTFLSQLHIKI